MRPLITLSALEAIEALGKDATAEAIARVITVMDDPYLGIVIVTPDEAIDRGDLGAIHARRRVLERLAARAGKPGAH